MSFDNPSKSAAPAVTGAESDGNTALDIELLGGHTDRESVERLLGYLAHQDPTTRWHACEALAQSAAQLRRRAHVVRIAEGASRRFAFTELLTRMQQNLQAPDPVLRATTADCLALFDHEAAVTLLGGAAHDPEPVVRVSAMTSLGRIADVAGIDWLVAALADPSMWVRRAAADALGNLGAPQAVDGLERALADPQPLVRAAVVAALGHIRSARARSLLERCTQDADPEIRWYAARSLGQVGDRASCAALSELRRQPGETFYDQTTAEVASAAIAAIEQRDRGLINRVRHGFKMVFLAIRRAFHKR